MDRYSDVVQNENGRAVPDASIQIIGEDGTLAVIYADRQGARLDNPITTDGLGRWSFCAADGVYTARVYMNGVLKATLPDIRLEDPDNGLASLAAPSGASLVGTPSGTVQSDLDAIGSTVASLKNYTLPPATSTTLGGMKPGNGLAAAPDGTVSATGLAAGVVGKVNAVAPDSSGNVTITTDNVSEGANPVNQWFTAARVRSALLTGLSLATNAAVAATDTVLAAIGKLQAQVSANSTTITSNTTNIATNTTAIATKDASGGYAGLTGFAINIKNAAGTILSGLASAATAARTWTFPDKSGTVALLSDIPASGSMVLLGSLTVSTSASNIDFLSVFTSAYDKYIIDLEQITVSTAAALSVRLAVAGVVDANSNYYGFSGNASAPGVANLLVAQSNIGTTASTAFSGTIEIRNTNLSMKSVGLRGFGNLNPVLGEGGYTNASAVSGFRLFPGVAANFITGTVRVYGIKNS